MPFIVQERFLSQSQNILPHVLENQVWPATWSNRFQKNLLAKLKRKKRPCGSTFGMPSINDSGKLHEPSKLVLSLSAHASDQRVYIMNADSTFSETFNYSVSRLSTDSVEGHPLTDLFFTSPEIQDNNPELPLVPAPSNPTIHRNIAGALIRRISIQQYALLRTKEGKPMYCYLSFQPLQTTIPIANNNNNKEMEKSKKIQEKAELKDYGEKKKTGSKTVSRSSDKSGYNNHNDHSFTSPSRYFGILTIRNASVIGAAQVSGVHVLDAVTKTSLATDKFALDNSGQSVKLLLDDKLSKMDTIPSHVVGGKFIAIPELSNLFRRSTPTPQHQSQHSRPKPLILKSSDKLMPNGTIKRGRGRPRKIKKADKNSPYIFHEGVMKPNPLYKEKIVHSSPVPTITPVSAPIPAPESVKPVDININNSATVGMKRVRVPYPQRVGSVDTDGGVSAAVFALRTSPSERAALKSRRSRVSRGGYIDKAYQNLGSEDEKESGQAAEAGSVDGRWLMTSSSGGEEYAGSSNAGSVRGEDFDEQVDEEGDEMDEGGDEVNEYEYGPDYDGHLPTPQYADSTYNIRYPPPYPTVDSFLDTNNSGYYDEAQSFVGSSNATHIRNSLHIPPSIPQTKTTNSKAKRTTGKYKRPRGRPRKYKPKEKTEENNLHGGWSLARGGTSKREEYTPDDVEYYPEYYKPKPKIPKVSKITAALMGDLPPGDSGSYLLTGSLHH